MKNNIKTLTKVEAKEVLEYAVRKSFEEALSDYQESFKKDVHIPVVFRGSSD